MNARLSIAMVGIGLATVVVAGCSTVTVRVPVMRPAEINLRGKEEIVVGSVTGPDATQILNRLKTAIASSGQLKLVSREHMDQVMQELQLSQSDLADTESRKKLGKMMTGSILVTAAVEQSNYDESVTQQKQTCTKTVDKKSVNYDCWKRTRHGRADVAVGFDVIDIETGENLRPKRLSCTETSETDAVDGTPGPINGDALLDTCRDQVVADFMKAIAPWQDFAQARFLKDSDVPPLEAGIQYAKRGEWQDAIQAFKSAVDMVDGQPGLDAKVVAKAHWDLGLAYEYTFQYEAAIEEVKKAHSMTLDEDFLQEVDNIKKLQQDQAKLKEQLAPPAGGAS